MKHTKAAGSRAERRVRAIFRDRGYVCFKSSDSAVADVIALRAYEPPVGGIAAVGYLIEVKANAGSPYMHFSGPERAALRAVATQAGLGPLLVHLPPRGGLREIPAEEWPPDGALEGAA